MNVLRSLGGSGGTIVGKALSACGAFVFSETNPRASTILNLELNALAQMRRLEPGLVPPFWRDVDPNALGAPEVFGAFIRDASAALQGAGRPVVVRDHCYTDYIGRPFVWPAPSQASFDAAFRPDEITAAGVVRHPVATFRSLRSHPHFHWCLDGPAYVEGALRFLRAQSGTPVFRYEDFLRDGDAVLRGLCGVYGLAYAPDWRSRLGGAPLASGHPRALQATEVAGPEPDSSSWRDHLVEMRRSPLFDALMEESGYASDQA